MPRNKQFLIINKSKLLANPLEVHEFECDDPNEFYCKRCKRPRCMHKKVEIEPEPQ